MGMTTGENSTEAVRSRPAGRCRGSAPRGGGGVVVARRWSAPGRRATEDRVPPYRESVPEVRQPRPSARGPQQRIEHAQVGFAALAVAAALTAVVVIVLLGTAHARAAVIEGLDPSGGASTVDTLHQDGVSDARPR